MASGSKVAVSNCSTYIQGAIDWSTSTSGSDIIVTVKFYMRRTNAWSGDTYSSDTTKYIQITGDPDLWNYSTGGELLVEGGQQNVWQGPYFTATRTFSSERAGNTIYVGWKTVENAVSGYLGGSGQTTITLPTPSVAPTKPTVSVSNATATSASVTYGTSSFGSPSTGTVYLYSGTATAPTTQLTTKTTTGNSTYSNTGLTSNTKYYYRARAYNGQLWSDYSDEKSIVTLPAALVSYSAAPVSGSQVSIKISYKTAADGNEYSKNIEYSLDGATWTTGATVSVGTQKSGSFNISGLTANTTYTISLRVKTTAGSTSVVTVQETTNKAPNAPTVVISNIGTTSASITYGTTSFGRPSTGTVTLYGGTTSLPTTNLDSRSSTGTSTYINAGLTANTLYYYRAVAKNNTPGLISVTTTKSAVTLPLAPVVALSSADYHAVTFNVSCPVQGTASSTVLRYSVDGGSYSTYGVIAPGSSKSIVFSYFAPSSTHTISWKFNNTTGDSSVVTVTVTTSDFVPSLYGPVNGQTKAVRKLYGPLETTVTTATGTIRADGAGNVLSFDTNAFMSKLESEGYYTDNINYMRIVSDSDDRKYWLFIYYVNSAHPTISIKPSISYTEMVDYGMTAKPPETAVYGTDYIDFSYSTSTSWLSKEIKKLYGSVNGVTKRIF